MAPAAVLRGLGLTVAACSFGQVIAEDPPCAIYGKAYNDPDRNATPNGGFPPSSKFCQDLCVNTVFCDRFTFYNNSKACWLQGNDNDTIFPFPSAISGPKRCHEIAGGWGSPKALSAEELAIWNKVAAGDVTYESDELEDTAKQLDLASIGVPDSVSTQVVAGTNYKFQFPDKKQVTVYKSLADELKVTNIVENREFTIAGDEQSEKSEKSQGDGGFPWWILLLILLALLALAACAWYFMDGSEKKNKKKKSAKAQPTAARQLEEGTPLVASGRIVAPAAAAAPPQAASAYYAPTAQAAMPMQYQQAASSNLVMSGAYVASPVAYQGVQVASPAMVAGAPPQYSYQQ
eukprot:TRINITY_DN102379_c0_g1_i1.p1 TRINITY_DN102379_c0_g1~~TRINITY_DN102379_c0_g1_i1.p1  ORF type:complete len:363 (-),score=81.66 TRINITY_DN102379_c0_g1_i1:235-1275(-)